MGSKYLDICIVKHVHMVVMVFTGGGGIKEGERVYLYVCFYGLYYEGYMDGGGAGGRYM